MRGKPPPAWVCLRSLRITPAGAGKTARFHTPHRCYRDHPRRCGENQYKAGTISLDEGSPPQVRGKLDKANLAYASFRITPAGAGKTKRTRFIGASLRDHPRRCGENRCGSLPYQHDLGSPPQVRGKLVSAAVFASTLRITPAGAGKTMTSRNSMSCA